MAQVVGYFQNNDTIDYIEGPFVLTSVSGELRVEVDGGRCPIIPDNSIIRFMEQEGIIGKIRKLEKAQEICDKLNQMVKDGKIIEQESRWILK